jgi:hypothetical protein
LTSKYYSYRIHPGRPNIRLLNDDILRTDILPFQSQDIIKKKPQASNSMERQTSVNVSNKFSEKYPLSERDTNNKTFQLTTFQFGVAS